MLPRLPTPSRDVPRPPPPAPPSGARATTPRSLIASELAAERQRIFSRGRHNVDTATHRGVDLSHLFDATPPSTAPPRTAPGSRRPAPSTATSQPGLRNLLLEEAARISKEEHLPVSCLPAHFKTKPPVPGGGAPSSVGKRFMDGARPTAVFPAALPTSRADVIAFIDELDARLNGLKENSGTPTLDRLEVLDETFVDLVRQNLVACVERGVLLEFVRVSIFACVNVLIDEAASCRSTTAALQEQQRAAEAKVAELEATVEELRETLRLKDSSSRTQQIHDITVQAKRSKTYIEYATAHFTRSDREAEQEAAHGEMRRRLFSVQLSSAMKQQETQEAYLKALAQVEVLQSRESEWLERLRAMEKHVAAIEAANSSVLKETREVGTDPIAIRLSAAPSPKTLGSPKRSMVNFAVSGGDDLEGSNSLAKSNTIAISFAARRQSQMFERRKSNAAPMLPSQSTWRQRANSLFKRPSFKTDITVESGTDSDEEDKVRDVETQTAPAQSDAEVDAGNMRRYLAQQNGEGFDEASTEPMLVAHLTDVGFLIDAGTNTDPLAVHVTPHSTPAALNLTPPPEALAAPPPVVVLKDPAFEVALRRLVLDKVKARPPKWVITTVSQIITFITEREPVIAPETDISGLALLFFRTKYGLEKLSDQYIAEFIVSMRQSLYRVRRVGVFARFIGLQRYLLLPESVDVKTPSASQNHTSVTFTQSSTSGTSRPTGTLVALPWNNYAHYSFILNTVRKLIPRKSAKELEETDTFELPAFGATSLIKQCYKKRLSDDALSLLFGALNAYDRTKVEPGVLIPPLTNIQSPAEHVRDSWPVDLLMELLAFSTNTIFSDLCVLSKAELVAAAITGVDDPKMWVVPAT